MTHKFIIFSLDFFAELTPQYLTIFWTSLLGSLINPKLNKFKIKLLIFMPKT